MFTIFVNGFEATRKKTAKEAITEMRMLLRIYDASVWVKTHDGYVYQLEDLEAFEERGLTN